MYVDFNFDKPLHSRRSLGRIFPDDAKKFNVSPRYVGRVCGENRHILIVPCHRVIRSDGHLGGYSAKGGISLKKKLLDFENVKIK